MYVEDRSGSGRDERAAAGEGARGVFAGVTLGGATLRADRDANERFYGVRLDSRQIVLEGRTGAALPEAAARLQRALDRLAPSPGSAETAPRTSAGNSSAARG